MELEQTTPNAFDANSDTPAKNILEEVNALNQHMRNSPEQVYKVSSAWNKQPGAQNSANIEATLHQILDSLVKMEAALTKIAAALSHPKGEDAAAALE